MDTKSEFLKKYSLKSSTLKKLKLNSETLSRVEKDYSSYKNRLVKPAEVIVENLRKEEAVSSLNYRIKETSSLMKKIVTKRKRDLKEMTKTGDKGFAVRKFNEKTYKKETHIKRKEITIINSRFIGCESFNIAQRRLNGSS